MKNHPYASANLPAELMKQAKAIYLWCVGDLIAASDYRDGQEEKRETLKEEWKRLHPKIEKA